MITPALLVAATGCTQDAAERFAPHLQQACEAFGVNTPARLAAFLAQIGHESGSFRHVRELADGSAYEGRKDLGNTQPGDGPRYRGRGLIQLTGRANARQMTELLRQHNPPDFEAWPEALEQPQWAAWSAVAFWDSRKLNALADAGDFTAITKRINGGLNGQTDRLARWERAKKALGAVAVTPTPAPKVEKKGSFMEPFTAAALAAITNVVPALIDMFKGDSKSAERNSEAAKIVVGVVKDAVGAANEQDLVQRLASDPAAQAAAKEAVERNWFEIQKADAASIREARDFMVTYSQTTNVRTVVGRFTFIEFLTLVFLLTCWIALGLLATFSKISEGTLDNIIMLAVVASIVGLREFWYGSSFGSRQKDATTRETP